MFRLGKHRKPFTDFTVKKIINETDENYLPRAPYSSYGKCGKQGIITYHWIS